MRKTKNNILDRIEKSISPEEQKEFDKKIEAHIKWLDEHPDYHKRYGTDKSYWLEDIIKHGISPIGITTMLCEETIILETKEEVNKAWGIFKPEGWWYSRDEFDKAYSDYVDKFYDGDKDKAPKVYWLNE